MKRLIVILCVILTLVSVATSVSAAKSVSITLSANDTSVGSGDKVTITVKATVDQCGAGGMEVSYDTKRFELISGEWLLDGILMDFNEKSKDGVFALASDKKLSGKIFQLVVKVKSDAPLGNGSVTFKFKADEKTVNKSISIKVQCNHKYSNNCDTTCNSCGATRKITHKWNSGSVIKEATCTATGSAKYTCTICKETKTDKIAKKAHAYDNGCDTDCNNCGATRQITHNFAWTCDSTNHWEACTVCGLAQDKSEHTLAADISGNETGHGYLCSVCNLIPDAQAHEFESSCDSNCGKCGYVRSIEHLYNERYSFDTEEHWYECSLCGDVLEKVAHTPGEEATETTDQICTGCGFIIVPAQNHEHSLYGDWLCDDNGHWYQCRCGAVVESVDHVWDDGRVDEAAGVVIYTCTDCAKVKAEVYVPETEPPEETIPEPEGPAFVEKLSFIQDIKILNGIPLWLLFTAVMCASIILNIVFVIAAIVRAAKKSKVKGKYE